MPVDMSSRENRRTHRAGHGNLGGAILAAGLGSRMKPLTTHHLPKPLFPLGGKVPMAELWVRRFVESGITDLSMNLCVLSDAIKRHFADGARFGAKIDYVEEQTPSGTLGGVCQQVLGTLDGDTASDDTASGDTSDGKPLTRGGTVIVPSGDIVTNFGSALLEEMVEIHRQAGAAFSMVLVPVPWDRRKDFGTVVLDNPEDRSGEISKSGRIIEFREKDPESPSNLNNASIYMIETELLAALDPLRTAASAVDIVDPFYDFGKHVFPAMLRQLPYVDLPKDYLLWGVQYDGAWFDVGQKRDYLRVNEQVLDDKVDIRLPFDRLPWGYLGTDVDINFSKVDIVPPVVIGNHCVIEDGAKLGPYAVVGDGWVVESGARIQRSVLWQRYDYFDGDHEIPAGDRVEVDPHRVAAGVKIDESIVVGGRVDRDVSGQTVDVLADGSIDVQPIDAVPDGPRA